MTKISTLPRQATIVPSDLFLVHSNQNADDILITGTNMIASLDIVTNASLSASINSKNNRVVTGNTSLTTTDEIILGDVSGGDFTINLMAASTVTKQIFIIKKTDGSSNTITLQPDGTDLIDNGTTASLTGPLRVFFRIYSDGSNWHIVG